MVAMLPAEVLQLVAQDYPCRVRQIRTLATFYNNLYPSPSILVAHGLEETHKLEVVVGVLEARKLKHVLIRGRECLSVRHLVGKIFAWCLQALDCDGDAEGFDRVDNLNALTVGLEKLFRKKPGEKIIMVLDGVDDIRGTSTGSGTMLLPALARMGDLIPQVSIILTTTSTQPLHLHKSGIPHVCFSSYTRAEAISLLSRDPPPIPSDPQIRLSEDDLQKIYTQFLITVYDSLILPTSSTYLSTFRKVSSRLWPRFVYPAISTDPPTNKSKPQTWDFAKLLIRNRSLFHSEGETALLDRLRPTSEPWTFEDLSKSSTHLPSTTSIPKTAITPPPPPPLLKHLSTLLLISSYLCSHTHPKNDILLFSRLSSTSSSSHRISKSRLLKSPHRPKKSKSTASNILNNTDGSSSKTNTTEGGGGGAMMLSADTTLTPNKQTRLRHAFDVRFGAPRSFTLERLVAVLRAIHPDGLGGRKGVADRVYREMGELERLRLVVKVDNDDEEGKWRVNVGKEVVESWGKGWGVSLGEWELDDG